MDALATNTPGGVNVTSAYRSPELNKSIGGAKNSLHSQGSAFDLSTKGLSDKEKRDLVERSVMSGAMEIGTYPDQSLHIGTVQRNAPIDPNTGEPQPTGGVAAMYDRTRSLYDNAPSWFHSGLEESQLAPTPTERPEQPSAMIAEQDEPKAPESLGLMDKAPTGGANTKTLDPNRFKDITDEDRNLMGMTLAGEIDPSKTDLTTEDGRKEAMGILSTVENRMGKYGSIKDTITAPKQYSTWNNDAAANTATKNYYANKDVYDKFVNDYVADPQQNLGFTSYHANTVNPGWSSAMSSPETIGPHTFGFLSEYAPKSTGPVTPTTVFNTQAMSAPKVSGVMSDENANRTSSLSVANKPASNNNSTSPSSNSSGTGFSSSPGGSGGTGTKTTGITAGGGWGQKSSSDDDSGTTNGGRSGYSGSRSDGW
jgi:hypothetical protein